jgi:3-oxoacyl-[acyl-carrier protein] reductase
MHKVLVTGGSRGIGEAISELFSENGYEVCSPGRDELDLNSRESIKTFIRKNKEGFDVIINNAGVNPINLIEETDEREMDEAMMINLIAPLLIIKGFAPKMKQRKSGRIVNIGSIWGVVSKPKRAVYSSSKHGLHGLTMTTALELSDFGILVNTVSPGFTLTDMTKKNNTSEEIDKIGKNIPLRRMADPIEIAKAVFFLGSFNNTYITGQNIVVDGGYSIQ